jgi:hypothetical protein
MNNESNNYIITVVGILLTLSELLPFIKTIKSNGIIQLVIGFCIFLLKKDKKDSNNETEQLLENFLEQRLNEIEGSEIEGSEIEAQDKDKDKDKDKIQQSTSNFVFSSQNITISFNSPNEIKMS